ncbi:hypothetical protein FRC00_000326 [Tulasnella sp. 408]|nr:hypothetical protein FRC00_000326 [Tulasnella sp. 408]
MAVFPGDPNDDGYDEHIPRFGSPFVFFMAKVLDKAVMLEDGKSRGFTAQASEYVREGVKDFKVHLALNVPSSAPVTSATSDDEMTRSSPSKRLFELPPSNSSPAKRSPAKASTSSDPASSIVSTPGRPRTRTKKNALNLDPPARSSESVEATDALLGDVDDLAEDADVEQLLAPVEPQVSSGKKGGRKRALPSP